MAVNTIAYFPPQLKYTGGFPDFNVESYPFTAAAGVLAGDVVKLVSGAISRGATNDTAIAGISMHAQAEIYVTPNANVTISTLFGFNEVGSGLFTGEPGNAHVVVPEAGSTEVEFSLIQSATYAQTLVGTQVGIVLDGTSNFYYVDPAQTNKVAVIVRLVEGPGQQLLGNTGGGRVVVKFIAAGLQV